MKSRFKLIITLMMLCSIALAWADVSEYVFTGATNTYQELTEPVEIATATVGSTAASGMLRNLIYVMPENTIPFVFRYNGLGYTGFTVSTNGYITFGSVTPSTSSYTPISASTAFDGAISALPANTGIQARTDETWLGDISYQVLGTAPDREFVIQYKNFRRYGTNYANERFSFQIRMVETSNVIKLVYGSFVNIYSTSTTVQVGLRGLTRDDFNNRTTTMNWSSTTAGTSRTATCTFSGSVYPISGLTFTFTPPTVANVPNFANIGYPSNEAVGVYQNVILQWSEGGGWTTGYKLYYGTDNPPSNIINGTDIGYIHSFNPEPDPAPLSTYYWQIVPYNSYGENTDAPVWSFVTAPQMLAGELSIGSEGDYPSFTAAITALNTAGADYTGVIFNVGAGEVFDENPPPITVSGLPAGRIVFRKYGSGQNPLLRPLGTAATNDYAIKLEAASYITFQGIDIANQSGTDLEYGFWLAGSAVQGCNYNIIADCNIALDFSNSNTRAIYLQSTAGSAGFGNNYNQIIGNTIDNTNRGILIMGSSSTSREDIGNRIQNNEISNISNYGIYAQAQLDLEILGSTILFADEMSTSLYGIYIDTNTTTADIIGNTVGGGSTTSLIGGIYINNGQLINVIGNTVSDLLSTGTSAVYAFQGIAMGTNSELNIINNQFRDVRGGGTVYGIYSFAGTTTNVHGNLVTNLESTTTGTNIVYGILPSSNFYNASNNMISDLRNPNGTAAPQVRGIHAYTGSSVATFYNNSIFLDTEGTHPSFSTAGLYTTTALTSVDIKNNIVVNKSRAGTEGYTVAFYRNINSISNITLDSDRNIYYAGVPSASNLIYYDGTNAIQQLDDYKAFAVNIDQGSYTEDVPFVSFHDLHIRTDVPTVVEGNAIPIASVTTDIDGNPRDPLTPDIGAHEGNFAAIGDSPETPANVRIDRDGDFIVVSWDLVDGVSAYKVYSSEDPELPKDQWLLEETVGTNQASLAQSGTMKFYYVTAIR